MYLIKNIYFTNWGKDVAVKNGLYVHRAENKLTVSGEYWGASKVHFCDCTDYSKLGKTDDESVFLLPYVSDFKNNENYVKDIGEGFKELNLHVGRYEPENIEGYIIFMRTLIKSVSTNGEKIFGRYQNEIVALLKDGDYIEFDGRRIEVISNKLVLFI